MAALTAAAATMVVATGTAAAGAGYYGPLPRLFLHFLSNIYMYIQYFNNNKPRVLKHRFHNILCDLRVGYG